MVLLKDASKTIVFDFFFLSQINTVVLRWFCPGMKCFVVTPGSNDVRDECKIFINYHGTGGTQLSFHVNLASQSPS